MKPENHVVNFLPDFLAGAFDDAQRNDIQSHLQSCASCRHEYESLSTLWKSLGSLPEERPAPALRERFNAMLAAYQQGTRHARTGAPVLEVLNGWIGKVWPRQPAVQFALASAVLIIGMFLGSRLGRGVDQRAGEAPDAQLSELRGEVQAMSRMLAISLMQQQSASERLRGVSLSYKTSGRDPQISSALLQALKYDPNVNVRLAALDALSREMDQASVRQELVNDLPKQSSPLVQIAMVDLIVQAREKQSLDVFRSMTRDPAVNAVVKKRIEEGMKQLM